MFYFTIAYLWNSLFIMCNFALASSLHKKFVLETGFWFGQVAISCKGM